MRYYRDLMSKISEKIKKNKKKSDLFSSARPVFFQQSTFTRKMTPPDSILLEL